MRSIVLPAVVGIATVLFVLLAVQSNGAEAAIPRDLATLSPIPTPTPALESPLYMPAVQMKWSPFMELLKTRYVFIERSTHEELGEGCTPEWIGWPSYWFYPSTGYLVVGPPNPVLPGDSIGYVGRIRSLSGAGSGMLSSLSAIGELPVPPLPGTFRLQSVTITGTVTYARGNETLTLIPGESWTEQEVKWREGIPLDLPGCVVTTTSRITNYGFLNRDQIIYP